MKTILNPYGWTRIALAVASVSPLPSVAASHIVDIQWGAEGRFVHKVQVQPGRFFEVCGNVKGGQRVAWSFKGGAPMNFNIHYHVGKDVVYPVKLDGVVELAQTLQPSAEQPHCWMWSNKQPAVVSLEIQLKLEP